MESVIIHYYRTNYQSWKFQMKVLFMEKDLWGFIEDIAEDLELGPIKLT